MRGVALDALVSKVLYLSGEKQRRGGNRGHDRQWCHDMGREHGPLLGRGATRVSAGVGEELGQQWRVEGAVAGSQC
jgi:hypothetical protein